MRVTYITNICRSCGDQFHPSNGGAVGRAQKYCSLRCAYDDRKGEKNHLWKNGRTLQAGYWKIRVDGKAVLEHRHIMEQHLGRPLLREEVVHHIDGDRSNNAIDNLKVIENNRRHMTEHGTFVSETHKRCTRCGKTKPRSEFYLHRNRPTRDPHLSRCKPCEKAVDKERRPWRHAGPEGRKPRGPTVKGR